jgi:hypothetical protein
MARTIKEIQEQIMTSVQEDPVLAEKLTSKSKAAIYRLWTFIVASAHYLLELMFDIHRSDMEALYENHHAHTLTWYEELSRAFLFGVKLIPFTRDFDTSGMTEEQIDEARLITYAACSRENRLTGRIYVRIKVAKGTEDREPLNLSELKAFKSYIHTTQDAGVDLECESLPGDRIRMSWKIYYDPQILNAEGGRVDGQQDDVVIGAIRSYFVQLPFNGLYVPAYHVDYLQAIEGIRVPVIRSAALSTDGGQQWTEVPEDGIRPEAGWCKFYDDAELEIEMIPFKYGENV